MPTPKEQYTAELNAIAERYGSMEDATIKRTLAMLKELRRQIAAELMTAQDFDAFRLNQLRASLEAHIARFQAQLSAEARAAFEQTIEDGAESVVAPLNAAGVETVFFRPSSAQLNVVLDFSARLIQDIADDMRRRIDQQLRLAVVGQKSPMQTMKDITRDMGIDARTGVWKKRHDPVKGVAARAETILRTEMQRAFNLANHSQQLETAKVTPGTTKSWIATADTRTRRGHLKAHMDYKNRPIPVDEPFIVYDITPKGVIKGSAKLMYPGDPNAPPQYTIQCRCRMATHHPAIGRIGSSLDGRIGAEMKRRAA
jgi:hypothetical protein